MKALFEELVGGVRPTERKLGIRSVLAQRFRGLERKLEEGVSVVVPISNHSLEAPFAFRNGRFNLIKDARFETSETIDALRTASWYAVEGKSIYDHRHPDYGRMQL